MSTDRDTTRIVRSWLRSDQHESANRVLDSVLDQLDTTPQRRAWWPARRLPSMNQAMRIALASAAVVVVALIGFTVFRGPGIGSRPIARTPSPTAAPSPVALPVAGTALTPGSYVIGDLFPINVTMDLGENWGVWGSVAPDVAAVYQETPDPPDGRGIIVVLVDNLYADPCHPTDGQLDPSLGPSVDDLATALTTQPSTDASEPIDVTLDGYSGKYLEYTMTGITEACPGGLTRWPSSEGPRQALDGEHDQVWIVDVDGVRLVIDAFSFRDTPAASMTEVRQIVESMQIEPGT
ncbi:MAG: hypothetical protein QOI85_1676 [Chloroflexota bacterium]|nr:hypothetical protein [Chloroflexota bacterium]